MIDSVLKFIFKNFKPIEGARTIQQICLLSSVGGYVSILFEGNHDWSSVIVATFFAVLAWFLDSQISEFGDQT